MGKEKKKGKGKPATGAIDKEKSAATSGGVAASGGEETRGAAAECAQCGISSAELKKCARCLQISYCGKE